MPPSGLMLPSEGALPPRASGAHPHAPPSRFARCASVFRRRFAHFTPKTTARSDDFALGRARLFRLESGPLSTSEGRVWSDSSIRRSLRRPAVLVSLDFHGFSAPPSPNLPAPVRLGFAPQRGLSGRSDRTIMHRDSGTGSVRPINRLQRAVSWAGRTTAG